MKITMIVVSSLLLPSFDKTIHIAYTIYTSLILYPHYNKTVHIQYKFYIQFFFHSTYKFCSYVLISLALSYVLIASVVTWFKEFLKKDERPQQLESCLFVHVERSRSLSYWIAACFTFCSHTFLNNNTKRHSCSSKCCSYSETEWGTVVMDHDGSIDVYIYV